MISFHTCDSANVFHGLRRSSPLRLHGSFQQWFRFRSMCLGCQLWRQRNWKWNNWYLFLTVWPYQTALSLYVKQTLHLEVRNVGVLVRVKQIYARIKKIVPIIRCYCLGCFTAPLLVPNQWSYPSQCGKTISPIFRLLLWNQCVMHPTVRLLQFSWTICPFWAHRCASFFRFDMSEFRSKLRMVEN